MKIGCLAFVLVSLTLPRALAQQASPTPESTPESNARLVWTAEMPAGDYIVRLTAITSISMHEYVVDASAKITEVTIATSGSEIARFYYIAPLTPQVPGNVGQSGVDMLNDKAKELADRTGASEWQKVVKNYPVSTHAHTIEYRVGSKDTLDKLFKSVRTAWLKDQSGTFKLKP